MTIDLDAPRPRGRPTKTEAALRHAARINADPEAGVLPDKGLFFQPVGIKFLADVFGMEQRTAHKKLRLCPPVRKVNSRGGHGMVPEWDFNQAAGYLVKPKIDLESYIRSLRVADLPPHISDAFWKGQRTKQAWEREAKRTWRDEEVVAVLGEVAMIIKDNVTLWIENMPGKDEMTQKQYESLVSSADGLMAEITTHLIEMPKKRRTESVIGEIQFDEKGDFIDPENIVSEDEYDTTFVEDDEDEELDLLA